ncbi:MAG: hypothetical protein FWG87_08750 [Defluviitaleaceae bacterium]|nr:hypothetical protein [Defluviitaleaceae bacterium]
MRICRFFVGDGFIRPEATSLCVNRRYPSQIDKRAYLGTDKSVPYKNMQFSSGRGTVVRTERAWHDRR